MRIIKWFFLMVVLTVVGLVLMDIYISKKAEPYLYSNIKKVPAKQAALVLGTAKYIAKGKKNYFYTYRIRSAVALWKAGKVKAIVVSGDNSTKYYDETTRMQKDLIKKM